jgi:chemotaxis receptor (MCP) glutamine deamidase CheD
MKSRNAVDETNKETKGYVDELLDVLYEMVQMLYKKEFDKDRLKVKVNKGKQLFEKLSTAIET